MQKPTRILGAAIVAAACAGLWGSEALHAQQPGFTRKMLQDQNLSAPGRHAVQVVAEFAPGVAAGKHTHPGEELGYVLEGSLLLEIEGEAPRTLKAGDSFFVPAGKPHDGKNTGSGPAKVLATYIVETGKPVASPVK
jgi:quercetin dioxygenase-like cupin family protein